MQIFYNITYTTSSYYLSSLTLAQTYQYATPNFLLWHMFLINTHWALNNLFSKPHIKSNSQSHRFLCNIPAAMLKAPCIKQGMWQSPPWLPPTASFPRAVQAWHLVFFLIAACCEHCTATQHGRCVGRPTTTQDRAGSQSCHLERQRHCSLSLWDHAQDDKDGLGETQLVMLLLWPRCWWVKTALGQTQTPPWLWVSMKTYFHFVFFFLHRIVPNVRNKPQVICLYPFEQSLLEQVALTQGALPE